MLFLTQMQPMVSALSYACISLNKCITQVLGLRLILLLPAARYVSSRGYRGALDAGTVGTHRMLTQPWLHGADTAWAAHRARGCLLAQKGSFHFFPLLCVICTKYSSDVEYFILF